MHHLESSLKTLVCQSELVEDGLALEYPRFRQAQPDSFQTNALLKTPNAKPITPNSLYLQLN